MTRLGKKLGQLPCYIFVYSVCVCVVDGAQSRNNTLLSYYIIVIVPANLASPSPTSNVLSTDRIHRLLSVSACRYVYCQ